MKNTTKTDPNACNESSPSLTSQNIKESHLSQASKSVSPLRDLPLKQKKKEASKPIYLTRYE